MRFYLITQFYPTDGNIVDHWKSNITFYSDCLICLQGFVFKRYRVTTWRYLQQTNPINTPVRETLVGESLFTIITWYFLDYRSYFEP